MPHQCTTCGRTFPDGSKEMLSGCPDCGGNKFQFQPGDVDASSTDGSSSGTPSGSSDGPTLSGQSGDRTPEDGGVAGTVAEAAGTVRDWVGRDDSAGRAGDRRSTVEDRSSTDSGPGEWPPVGRRDPDGDPTRRGGESSEDTAQASARSDVVDPNELPEDVPETDRSDPGPSDPGGSDPTRGGTVKGSTSPEQSDPSEDSSPFTGAGSSEEESPDLEELRDELNEQFESIRIVSPGQYELNLMELYDREEYIISLMEDGRYAIEVPEAWRGEN